MKRVLVFLVALMFLTGCLPQTSSEQQAPVFQISIGAAKVIRGSITINDQVTFTQRSPAHATRSIVTVTSQTVSFVLQLEFNKTALPPSGTYVQCGNVMLSPSQTGVFWVFQGMIPSVPKCTIYVYDLPYEFETGIAATTVMVGNQQVVISDTNEQPSYLFTNVVVQSDTFPPIELRPGTVITLSLPPRTTYIQVSGETGNDLPVLAVCSADNISKGNVRVGGYSYKITGLPQNGLCVIGRPDAVLLVMYWSKR